MGKLHSQRIGIFDSGVGGITVLRQLYRQLPQESVLYFADTARLPYGTRSPEEIIWFVREILAWFRQHQVKMVIMACNTSSALALEAVQAEFDFPVLGLILPGARAAVQQGERIGVISTPATAQSHAYRQAIQEISPRAQVWEMGCPEFVPIIENNRLQDPASVAIVRDRLAPLLTDQIDTLIYGCTHYPHLAPIIRNLVPPTVRLVDPAVHVVAAAARELKLLGLANTEAPLATRFCVSGDPVQFATVARQWLGCTPLVTQVHLQELNHAASLCEG
jgi:glutamate racemase